MATRPRKEEDEVVSALHAVEHLIGGKLTTGSIRSPGMEAALRNPRAVELGTLGASKGGKARAAKLSKKRRAQIAKIAARVRWSAKP
ncbi:MAG: hypothetical protein ABSA52_05610 [Candidatus Binatia bacterium]|jgi:hypothetical protein